MESWLISCENHFARHPQHNSKTLARDMVRVATYGMVQFDRKQFADVYQRHYDAVQSYFVDSPHQLLVLDVSAPDALSRLSTFMREHVDNPLSMTSMPHLKLPFLGPLEAVAKDEMTAKRPGIKALLAR